MAAARSAARNRGFTLIEIFAVLAILAILALLVFPSIVQVTSQSREQAEVRRVLSELRRARAIAASRRRTNALTNDTIRSAGIAIVSATEYFRFFDIDNAPGGETTEAVVDLTQTNTNLTIQNPAVGQQIRFRSDGTLLPGSANQLQLAAPSGRVYTVNIALTGLSQID